MQDNRREDRVGTRIIVRTTGEKKVKILARNISAGGVMIELPGEFATMKVDDRLPLTLIFPKDIEIEVETVVRWRKQWHVRNFVHIGVEFVNIHDEARDYIKNYIMSQLEALALALKELVFFEQFTAEEIKTLRLFLFYTVLGRAEIILGEGQEGDSFFILISGLARVFRLGSKHEAKVIETIQPGQIFGELSLITGDPRSAFVEAVNPSKLIGLTRPAYSFIQEQYPKLAIKIMNRLLSILAFRLKNITKKYFSPMQLNDVFK